MSETTNRQLPVIAEAKRKFELACKDAASLQIVNNFGAAFQAVAIVSLLREAMSDEVMNQVFIPLMNTRLGFLTDKTGIDRKTGARTPLYPLNVVRDAIIDAVGIGLLPTGNQFNIIAGRMYPTKEGYTALLRKQGVKYFIEVGYDKSQTQGFAEIPCKITYQYNGEKNGFSIVATVKKDNYSSADQLRGKAERRAKKALYEFVTGCDFGDADETSSKPEAVDVVATEVATEANTGDTIRVPQEEMHTQPRPQAQPQPAPHSRPQQPTSERAPQATPDF